MEYIDYMICICRDDNIYDYLIEKYKNKLTDKINKENLLKVKFKHIEIEEHPDLEITKDKELINTIKELENDNIPILNGFIFLKIREDVAECIDDYITFYVCCLYGINYINNTIIFKCSVDNFIKYNEDVISLNEMLEEYMTYEFISATINIDKYYNSFFESGVPIEKNDWIDDMSKIIIYEGDEVIDDDN